MRRVRLYRLRLLFLSVFLGTPFFFILPASALNTPSIRIHEVQISGDSSDDEFIELYNPTLESIDISGWQLRRKTETGSVSSIKVFPKDTTIKPRGFYLWANTKGSFTTLADTTTSSSALADNNSIALYTASGSTGVLIDTVSWGTGSLFIPSSPQLSQPHKNESFSQLSPDIWTITKPSTPQNSFFIPLEEVSTANPIPPVPSPEIPLPKPIHPLNTSISINEIFPSPLSSQEEFIELYNQSDQEVDISNWSLHDASKTGKYIFPKGSSIKTHEFLVIPKSLFHFALNNSNESLTLTDDEERLIQKIIYKKSIAGVSLNQSPDGLRGGTPTPGKENILNSLPITREKVPKKGFRDIKISFDAKGTDTEDKKLKYVWDFGDGHKSYLEKTSHTYQKTGTYTITLTTEDQQDEVTETFTLKIEKYTSPKLRIKAFLPNPEGSDTGKEWVEIENKSHHDVDLQGFSLATGTKSKKLTNHPIKDSLILPKGKILLLTREASLFTLPNTRGAIELRVPNGEVIDSVRYKEEKSVAENTVYRKKKGAGWTQENTSTEIEADDTSTSEEESLDVSEDTPTKTPPPEITRTEEEKQRLYANLEKLFTPTDFVSYEVVTDTNTVPLQEISLISAKKKDSFESFQEKLNASILSVLW